MRRTFSGTELRLGWGGGRAVTPGAMVQLPPQRTAKLGRAYRLVCHWLWQHRVPERWGGSDAEHGAGSCPATPGATGVLSPQLTKAEATARSDRGYNLLRLVVAKVLLTEAMLKA